MNRRLYIFCCILLAFSCQNTNGTNPQTSQKRSETASVIDPSGTTVEKRFPTPKGFSRVSQSETSFGSYLRKLPLKKHGSMVRYFDGDIKSNSGVYDAVVDLPIGKRDLHQCADAVMRLKADYHFSRGEYEKIHFNFTNGFRMDYSEWRKGKRLRLKDNNFYWKQHTNASDSPESYWKYMEMVFAYAGTLSLSKELAPVQIADMNIGDVFIIGGSPGHAVIVVDMATNEGGEKIFLLAQSYMPAQEIQILQNPNDGALSPWYSADFGNVLETPQWTFHSRDLKRFKTDQ